MQPFQFAQVLQAKRQERKITQEEVAKFVGVTRAAVSKWEKGISYPDITLLPKLATYFDLSIDMLLGYEPQMTKEKIDSLYADFTKRFATEPFEIVEAVLEEIVQEYYACYPLLLRIVQLYMNYYKTATNPMAAIERAQVLVEHIKMKSTDFDIQTDAQMYEAFIYLLQGKTENVLAALGDKPIVIHGRDQLIATAHAMNGNTEQAKEVLQVSIYQQLLAFVSNSTELLMLEMHHTVWFEETIEKIETLIYLYKLEDVQVNTVLVFYIKTATAYMMLQQTEATLRMIERYIEVVERIKFPISLHITPYFYKVEEWLHNQTQISMQAPRDMASIIQDIMHVFSGNPLFAALQENETYQKLMKRLALIEQKGGSEHE